MNAAAIFDWCDSVRGWQTIGMSAVAHAPISETRVRSRAEAMGYQGVDLLKLLVQVDYFERVSKDIEVERLNREG